MSLKSPRSAVFLLLSFVLVAVLVASCGGSSPSSPVAPSLVSGVTANETPADEPASGPSEPADEETPSTPEAEEGEEPKPEPEPDPKPAPVPAPAPVPGPAPAPVPATEVPTNPGPYPAPPLKNAILWTPTIHKRVILKIEPSPVLFSGVPVPLFSCRDLPHTWYYTQVIHNDTGIPFKLTERENYFDGRLVSRTPENIEVGGNGTHKINSRWCSAFGDAHTAQHRFKGRDEEGTEIIVNGPVIQLQKNPHWVPPPPAPGTAPRGRSIPGVVAAGG